MIEPCEWCPRAGQVHHEKDATVFLMCVVNVPGEVPVIVTTPKFCVNPAATDEPLSKLVDVIRTGGHDMADEVSKKLGLSETVQTAWGQVPVGTNADASANPKCPQDGGCR